MKKLLIIFVLMLTSFCTIRTTYAQVRAEAKRDGLISVKDFGAVGDGVTDDTQAIQNAIDAAWDNGGSCFIPEGNYKVSTLNMPKTGSDRVDMRASTFRLYGAGAGAVGYFNRRHKGTALISTTDAPILKYNRYKGAATAASNAFKVEGIGFYGNSSTAPVVYFESMNEFSVMQDCVIVQAGTGDGLKIDFVFTSTVQRVNIINRDWIAPPGQRVGTGVRIPSFADGGLFLLFKVSCRGWENAYIIGDGVHNPSATTMRECESSTCTNGITINTNVTKCLISHCYFEAVEGTAITDNGGYTSVRDCFFYPGFSTGIQSTAATTGNVYDGNYFITGDKPNVTIIDITSSGRYGGPSKSVINNDILYGFSGRGSAPAGVTGIKIHGVDPRLTITGNAFTPRGTWIGGPGTSAIADLSTSSGGSSKGTTGFTVEKGENKEFPLLAQGAISLGKAERVVDNSNIQGGQLSLTGGTYFEIAPQSPATITAIDPKTTVENKVYLLRVSNTNATFSPSALMKLAGGAKFTGPGVIMFIIDKNVAYEINRTVY
jgi:hypothetical protein